MKNLDQKARFYHALGEPIRLKIVDYLLTKKCACICELTRIVKRDQSVVFRHIQLLKGAKIIGTKKVGKFLMCCITDKTVERYLRREK